MTDSSLRSEDCEFLLVEDDSVLLHPHERAFEAILNERNDNPVTLAFASVLLVDVSALPRLSQLIIHFGNSAKGLTHTTTARDTWRVPRCGRWNWFMPGFRGRAIAVLRDVEFGSDPTGGSGTILLEELRARMPTGTHFFVDLGFGKQPNPKDPQPDECGREFLDSRFAGVGSSGFILGPTLRWVETAPCGPAPCDASGLELVLAFGHI